MTFNVGYIFPLDIYFRWKEWFFVVKIWTSHLWLKSWPIKYGHLLIRYGCYPYRAMGRIRINRFDGRFRNLQHKKSWIKWLMQIVFEWFCFKWANEIAHENRGHWKTIKPWISNSNGVNSKSWKFESSFYRAKWAKWTKRQLENRNSYE